jgi:hypothetical protein
MRISVVTGSRNGQTRLWGCLVLAITAACGGGSRSPAAPTPGSPSPGPTDDGLSFRVAVLLSASSPPSSDDVRRVFTRADVLLSQKTGEHMTQTDLTTVGPGTPLTQAVAYVNAHAATPPDGVLAFADDATATSFGGYSQTFALPPPNENRFPSPVVGRNQGYLAVVHFSHMYARCGYDDAGNRIGTTSAGGECRNRSGSCA